MMNTINKFVALTAAFVVAGVSVADTASNPIMVNTSPAFGQHWMTVFTNKVDLMWVWSATAEKVQLDISSMNGAAVTENFTPPVSNYLWQVFASELPPAEDMYHLTLTFSTDADVVVSVLTTQLAVVTGAFGSAPVNAVSNNPAWSKVRTNVVIPYDAGFAPGATDALTTQFVIAQEVGRVQTNMFADTSGYYGWKIKNNGWGYGTFDLAVTFPGTAADALTAELMRSFDGTIFYIH